MNQTIVTLFDRGLQNLAWIEWIPTSNPDSSSNDSVYFNYTVHSKFHVILIRNDSQAPKSTPSPWQGWATLFYQLMLTNENENIAILPLAVDPLSNTSLRSLEMHPNTRNYEAGRGFATAAFHFNGETTPFVNMVMPIIYQDWDSNWTREGNSSYINRFSLNLWNHSCLEDCGGVTHARGEYECYI